MQIQRSLCRAECNQFGQLANYPRWKNSRERTQQGPSQQGRIHSSAAQTIGGDFNDFFRYPGKAICAETIGDASGKGASATIYAALVAGILRSLAPLELGPTEMLSRLNKALLTRPIQGTYGSMIYATWDEPERVFRIANAGLPYPICVQNAKIFALQVAGLPLGLFESAEYEEHMVTCEPGRFGGFLHRWDYRDNE
jgi:phosphoserine phosphatase RsbU/P